MSIAGLAIAVTVVLPLNRVVQMRDAGSRVTTRIALQSPGRARWYLIGLLIIQTVLVGVMAWRKSVTNDEIAHIPAAVCYLQFQRYELYRVNPPLARYLAGLPVVLAGCETDWSSFDPAPGRRTEWAVGHDFIRVNKDRYLWLLFVSRMGLLPFLWLGTIVIWKWAGEHGRVWASLIATTLWAFDPNVLGNAALVTCDVPATAMGVLAAWRFHHWLKEPSYREAYLAGVCCGLALLTKTVWIVLPPLWTACWVFQCFTARATMTLRNAIGQLTVCGLIALTTLNAGYGFEGSFRQLGDYQFVSRSLCGSAEEMRSPDDYGNRFAETVLADIPVPLPQSFVQGIDEQRRDFESEHGGYLGGEYRSTGFWYYYVYGILVKTPVSTLILLTFCAIGLVSYLVHRSRSYPVDQQPLTDVVIPIAHGMVILVLVSGQPGLNSFFRYLLPAFPLAMITAGIVGSHWINRRRAISVMVVFLLLGGAAESLFVFPHLLSFFNAATGGPAQGGKYLLGTNLDWGQDLGELDRWMKAHPEVTTINLIHTNFGPVDLYSIQFLRPEFADYHTDVDVSGGQQKPSPGWYAISANYLYAPAKNRLDANQRSSLSRPMFQEYFRSQQPVACAGYSFHIFWVPESAE
jgi:hypothetical protein